MKSHTVTVIQSNQKRQSLVAFPGQNLLSLFTEHGLVLPSPCGGKGICGKCKVKILGQTRTNPAEYRLACQVRVSGDLTVELPDVEEKARIMMDSDHTVSLDPLITERLITLPTPTVGDQTSDVERVEQALGLPGCINPELFPALPAILRTSGYTLSAVLSGDEVLTLQTVHQDQLAASEQRLYGVALDLGTTTMVGYLLDLTTGQQLSTYAALNPQRLHGADVISRVDYTVEHENGLTELSQLVRAEINKMIAYFSRHDPTLPQSIYQMAIVGNTIMLHLLAGLEVENIAVAPFIPVVTRDFECKAAEVGIKINPQGRINILPMISGFVGADTVAAILASNLAEQAETSLLLDIGTNGEIAIGNQERILTCSAAAGPAFEGTNIRAGMGGIAGAINQVWITEELNFTTIGDQPARGICGSGVVSLTAQLLKAGLMETSGRLKSSDELGDDYPLKLKQRLCQLDGKSALLVAAQAEGTAEDLYFTQQDIRETQLAKAAIAAGVRILLKEMGITAAEVKTLYLAGGFGNYIDPHEAVQIGLLPKELEERVVPIGNGAGTGAKMVLLSRKCLQKSRQIQAKATYLELSTRSDFQTLFVDSLEFR